MTPTIESDPRLDPRIKAYFAGKNLGGPKANVSSREELRAQEHSAAGLAAQKTQNARFDSPRFATDRDVQGLPPSKVMGTSHGIEIMPVICPDIAHATAGDIASFAIG